MPFLLTDSATPLLMETVPALKIRHFYGNSARGNVYAYLRCYVHKGDFYCCMSAFDAAPPAGTRMALALCPAEDTEKFLLFSLSKEESGNTLTLRSKDGKNLEAFEAPPTTLTCGEDEQGLFWSRTGVLSGKLFKKIFNTVPHAGDVYTGNVLLYQENEAAFGTAFCMPSPLAGSPIRMAGFETFTIVPY